MVSGLHSLLHPHHDRKEASPPAGPLHDRSAADMDRPRARETQALAHWGGPLDGAVGLSSKVLREHDFELVKTLGTGTFARVWLVRLRDADTDGGTDAVFALKILRKVDVIRLKQVEHVRNERNVLAAVAGHPFITTLVASFQSLDSLYMVLDYCPGGEVFSYLRRARRFNEPTAQFYAAEIVLILEFLHEHEGVAYRDLKPENILIDAHGHLKLVDFGFAKKVDNRASSCGPLADAKQSLLTQADRGNIHALRNARIPCPRSHSPYRHVLPTPPPFVPSHSPFPLPSAMLNSPPPGHGTAVDWWAFGILVYEFLVGQPPFWDQNPMKIYEQIVDGRLRFPSAMSPHARDLISGLCTVDTSKRLGNISGGAARVKSHPWFAAIDWEKLYRREMDGPIIPHLRGPADTRNFDEYEPESATRDPYTKELSDRWDEYFRDF